MKKNIKMCPATKFIVWCILGLLICLIGISNVFADTYTYSQFTAQLYDNYGPTLSAVTTDQTNGRWQGAIPTMTANSSGAAWGVSSNMVLLANHTYTLTAEITGTYGGRLVLSTYNRIGVGTTLANAKTSYQNNTYVTENYSRVLDNGSTIQFAFTPTTNGSYIVFPFATNYTGSNQYFYLSSYTLDDLGASGGVSQSDINNSLSSQTNTLNQSITNSQNAIIQNNNDNTQAIIDSNRVCTQYDKNAIELDNQYLDEDGVVNNLTGYGISSYISININGSLKVLNARSDSAAFCFYDVNKTLISCSLDNTVSSGDSISIPNDASFFRFSILKVQNKPTYEYCANGSQVISDGISDLNNTINDDNVDSSSWANFFNNFTTNTFGLTSIVTAPLNLIQSLTNTTCTDLQLPLPYLTNKYLTLPCMSTIYSQYFGSFFTLYQTITYGIVAYWVCVRIFNLVKDFKNPEHDEIEVVDL